MLVLKFMIEMMFGIVCFSIRNIFTGLIRWLSLYRQNGGARREGGEDNICFNRLIDGDREKQFYMIEILYQEK